jgi:hypothetical protein
MTVVELVDILQRQGFTLLPLPEGKLAVKPADRLTDDLRQHIRQRKDEIVTLLVSNRPYINARGELIIPFDCDPKYHYWKGGQSIAATLRELNASREVWVRHTDAPYGPVQ